MLDVGSGRVSVGTMFAGYYCMRNIFDQYSQPENKLTHALACCLHEDGDLLREFAGWLSPRSVPEGRLRIVEQTLPHELDHLETRVDGPFLIGSRLSIADIALVTTFVNARYAGYEVDPDRWPGLAEYVAGQLASPLFERRLEQEAAYLASVTPR